MRLNTCQSEIELKVKLDADDVSRLNRGESLFGKSGCVVVTVSSGVNPILDYLERTWTDIRSSASHS